MFSVRNNLAPVISTFFSVLLPVVMKSCLEQCDQCWQMVPLSRVSDDTLAGIMRRVAYELPPHVVWERNPLNKGTGTGLPNLRTPGLARQPCCQSRSTQRSDCYRPAGRPGLDLQLAHSGSVLRTSQNKYKRIIVRSCLSARMFIFVFVTMAFVVRF